MCGFAWFVRTPVICRWVLVLSRFVFFLFGRWQLFALNKGRAHFFFGLTRRQQNLTHSEKESLLKTTVDIDIQSPPLGRCIVWVSKTIARQLKATTLQCLAGNRCSHKFAQNNPFNLDWHVHNTVDNPAYRGVLPYYRIHVVARFWTFPWLQTNI